MKSSVDINTQRYDRRNISNQSTFDQDEKHSRASGAVYLVRDETKNRHKLVTNFSGHSLLEEAAVGSSRRSSSKGSMLPIASSIVYNNYNYQDQRSICSHNYQPYLPMVEFSASRPAPPLRGTRLGVKIRDPVDDLAQLVERRDRLQRLNRIRLVSVFIIFLNSLA